MRFLVGTSEQTRRNAFVMRVFVFRLAFRLRSDSDKGGAKVAASRESSIVRAIVEWIKGQGEAHVMKTHGGPQRRGLPDLVGVYRGRAFALEVKREGGAATPLQEHELAEWRRAGAVAGVVHSVEEARRMLEGET